MPRPSAYTHCTCDNGADRRDYEHEPLCPLPAAQREYDAAKAVHDEDRADGIRDEQVR